MRRCVVVMTLVLLGAAACGDGFREVVGRLGAMDCPSEYVEHFTSDIGAQFGKVVAGAEVPARLSSMRQDSPLRRRP